MDNKKTFVLDTSVLLYSASSIRSFGSKNVVIPYKVLEELDIFKNKEGETGRNARQVTRELNNLRANGKLSEGVKVTEKGGMLYVLLENEQHNNLLNLNVADDYILNCALALSSEDRQVVVVSKDINLCVRADALEITAQDFTSDKLVESAEELYRGVLEVEIPVEMISRIHSGEVLVSELSDYLETDIYPNQYISARGLEGEGSCLMRCGELMDIIKPLKKAKSCWGVSPRNREQHFAFDALMDETIPLVTLMGKAGSGKSLIALACALEQVNDLQKYDKLVVTRPVQPMGRDLGYLPGTVEEKLEPWMGPLKDSINFLMKNSSKAVKEDMYNYMIETGMLEIEALTYIRGRSIPNTLFLLDEAQDLTKNEIKTIVSRMGENSKLIITGDVLQISNLLLDSTSSGLSTVVEKFKKYKQAAHITLEKGERSELATLASTIL